MNPFYVIRQRRGTLWIAFFLCAAAYLVYAALFVREYSAFAQVHGSSPNGVTSTTDAKQDAIDFAAHVRLVESAEFLRGMEARLSDEDRKELQAPFQHWWSWGAGTSAGAILLERRVVNPNPESLIIDIGFRHPNAELAARIANALAAEMVKQSEALTTQHHLDVLGSLQAEVDGQSKKAEDIKSRIDALINQYGRPKLDPGSIMADLTGIQALTNKANDLKAQMDQLVEAKKRIDDQIVAGQPVWQLSFVAQQERIVTQIREYQTQLARLDELRHEQYAEDSAVMLEQKGRIDGIAKQLAVTADTIASQVSADLNSVQTALAQTVSRLNDLQKQAQELNQARTEFADLLNQQTTVQKTLSAQTVALSEKETEFKLTTTSYSVLASAEVPFTPDPRPWGQF